MFPWRQRLFHPQMNFPKRMNLKLHKVIDNKDEEIACSALKPVQEARWFIMQTQTFTKRPAGYRASLQVHLCVCMVGTALTMKLRS